MDIKKLFKISTIFLLSMTVGCSYVHNVFTNKLSQSTSPTPHLASQPLLSMGAATLPVKVHFHDTLAPASAMVVEGDFDLKVIVGTSATEVDFDGDETELMRFNAYVADNGALYIKLTPDPEHPPLHRSKLIVRIHTLQGFNFEGIGNVTLRGLRGTLDELSVKTMGNIDVHGNIAVNHLVIGGSGLTSIRKIRGTDMVINISGNRHVDLVGMMEVRKIELSDDARLGMYWINTNHLDIALHDNAFLELGGIAAWISGTIDDKAYYNGRYLRTHTAFIRTFHRARADLNITAAQHTMARDKSNIYFYKQPEFHGDYMSEFGSVLSQVNMPPPWTLNGVAMHHQYLPE